MLRYLYSLLVFTLLLGSGLAQELGDSHKKIAAAKETYHAERDKAEQGLIAALERKESAAKQTGDIKTIEAVRAELDAFRKEGKLPKLVPLTSYETALKAAQTKLENTYLAVIKSYTQADKIAEAKELQTELEQFNFKLTKLNPAAVNDPLLPKSVWQGEGNTMTILERHGERFKASIVNKKFEREVETTLKDNKFSWQPDEVKVIRGDAGRAHYGSLTHEKGATIILMTYGDPANPSGSYVLRQVKK